MFLLERRRGRFDTEEKKPRNQGQDCSDVGTSQEMPTATRSWKQRGVDSPLESPEGAQSC